MTYRVSVLATGSELLDGRVVDTNSNFVAKELSSLGLTLTRILTVTDDKTELLEALSQLSAVSDCIITSGGLGPTTDDLTREVVTTFCKVPLEESLEARKNIEAFFQRRNRTIDDSNAVKALIPKGSPIIWNEHGTAPGFIATSEAGVRICALSGVPREFTAMFKGAVLPLIQEQSKDAIRMHSCVFKTFGLPESIVGSRIRQAIRSEQISISYRAAFREVHVTLKAPATVDLTESSETVRRVIGAEFIYSTNQAETLPLVVQQLLRSHNATVATAESCTGGLLAGYLTEDAGASDIYPGGVVSYSNDIKESMLAVPSETLKQFGAVSAETVRFMAESVRTRMNATYGLSISGVAGPSGGSEEKPVGTVFFGVAGPDCTIVRSCFYPNTRDLVRRYAAFVALDMLRRTLLGLQIPSSYPITDLSV